MEDEKSTGFGDRPVLFSSDFQSQSIAPYLLIIAVTEERRRWWSWCSAGNRTSRMALPSRLIVFFRRVS